MSGRARALLEVDGIGVSFGEQQVLKTASFSAWPGKITSLMGRNGTGKSTLLRVAVGLVRPQWGRVLFGGTFFPRPSLAELAKYGLMYSAQESALTDLFTIRDHIDAFARAYDSSESVREVVDRLKLDYLLNQRPHQLSGGEKQRATLGLALIRRPSCLLMDEPFAGVEPLERPIIAEGLLELRDQGSAIVVSGHDVPNLFAVSDEVIWVMSGTTHWLGSPEQAARHDGFRRTYLGSWGDAVFRRA